MDIVQLLAFVLLMSGSLMGVAGGIGLLRFPDYYTRVHAASITDTLCSGLFLGGLALHFGLTLASAKLALIFAFMLFTTPTASHALTRAARHGGLEPWRSAETGREGGA